MDRTGGVGLYRQEEGPRRLQEECNAREPKREERRDGTPTPEGKGNPTHIPCSLGRPDILVTLLLLLLVLLRRGAQLVGQAPLILRVYEVVGVVLSLVVSLGFLGRFLL